MDLKDHFMESIGVPERWMLDEVQKIGFKGQFGFIFCFLISLSDSKGDIVEGSGNHLHFLYHTVFLPDRTLKKWALSNFAF
jgi:hypothetical protein